MTWKIPATPKTARALKKELGCDIPKPLPVGVLLSGIDGPVQQQNTEVLITKRVRKLPA